MNSSVNTASDSAIQLFEPVSDIVYSIETASHLTHIPRRTIAVYCRRGLVSPVVDPEREGWFFDGDGIRTLRSIQRLRAEHGVNLNAIALIFQLMQRLEELQVELRLAQRC